MRFTRFEERAAQDWERIPDAFKEGIDGLVIVRDAKAHDRSPGVWTLGECLTESWPSDFDGPDTIRSELILYYGSFRKLAAEDDAFDWEGEIWETITHELKHHLESLAAEDDLEDVDAAMEQHFRRHDGHTFDPFYYRGGEPHEDGWYRLEDAWFLEVRAGAVGAAGFRWRDRNYTIELSESTADVTFVSIDGVDDAPDELTVVVVRPKPLHSRIGALLRRERPTVEERTAIADVAK